MKLRIALVVAALAVVVGCQCENDLCASSPCGAGMVCEPETGMCRAAPKDAGNTATFDGGEAVDGGNNPALCDNACPDSAPLCDATTRTCRVCSQTLGCGGLTPICVPEGNAGLGQCVTCTAERGCQTPLPYCDLSVQGGVCIGCRTNGDCSSSDQCDPIAKTCFTQGGGGGGGDPDAGPTIIEFDDAGMTTRCLAGATGPAPAQCTSECGRGFVCVSGQCVLRGSSGPIQMTLRFSDEEDLDLHVVEPLANGNTCEIYYAMPNTDAGIPSWLPIPPIPLPPSGCGSHGWLDLDSNPACKIDRVKVENVIYPPGVTPTKGKYIVRVVYYQNCGANKPVPYEVEVRANGQTRWYCGTFQPYQSNGGNQGAGTTVTEFWVK